MDVRIIALLGLAAHLGIADAAEPLVPAAVPPNTTNRFLVNGMHCSGCAKGLAAELRLLSGVARAEVTLSNRLALVAFDTNRVTVERILKAVEESGFTAALEEAKPEKPAK